MAGVKNSEGCRINGKACEAQNYPICKPDFPMKRIAVSTHENGSRTVVLLTDGQEPPAPLRGITGSEVEEGILRGLDYVCRDATNPNAWFGTDQFQSFQKLNGIVENLKNELATEKTSNQETIAVLRTLVQKLSNDADRNYWLAVLLGGLALKIGTIFAIMLAREIRRDNRIKFNAYIQDLAAARNGLDKPETTIKSILEKEGLLRDKLLKNIAKIRKQLIRKGVKSNDITYLEDFRTTDLAKNEKFKIANTKALEVLDVLIEEEFLKTREPNASPGEALRRRLAAIKRSEVVRAEQTFRNFISQTVLSDFLKGLPGKTELTQPTPAKGQATDMFADRPSLHDTTELSPDQLRSLEADRRADQFAAERGAELMCAAPISTTAVDQSVAAEMSPEDQEAAERLGKVFQNIGVEAVRLRGMVDGIAATVERMSDGLDKTLATMEPAAPISIPPEVRYQSKLIELAKKLESGAPISLETVLTMSDENLRTNLLEFVEAKRALLPKQQRESIDSATRAAAETASLKPGSPEHRTFAAKFLLNEIFADAWSRSEQNKTAEPFVTAKFADDATRKFLSEFVDSERAKLPTRIPSKTETAPTERSTRRGSLGDTADFPADAIVKPIITDTAKMCVPIDFTEAAAADFGAYEAELQTLSDSAARREARITALLERPGKLRDNLITLINFVTGGLTNAQEQILEREADATKRETLKATLLIEGYVMDEYTGNVLSREIVGTETVEMRSRFTGLSHDVPASFARAVIGDFLVEFTQGELFKIEAARAQTQFPKAAIPSIHDIVDRISTFPQFRGASREKVAAVAERMAMAPERYLPKGNVTVEGARLVLRETTGEVAHPSRPEDPRVEAEGRRNGEGTRRGEAEGPEKPGKIK